MKTSKLALMLMACAVLYPMISMAEPTAAAKDVAAPTEKTEAAPANAGAMPAPSANTVTVPASMPQTGPNGEPMMTMPPQGAPSGMPGMPPNGMPNGMPGMPGGMMPGMPGGMMPQQCHEMCKQHEESLKKLSDQVAEVNKKLDILIEQTKKKK